MNQQKMLEVNGLVKRYDAVTAVDHLSFEVYGGEIFGLPAPFGPSSPKISPPYTSNER